MAGADCGLHEIRGTPQERPRLRHVRGTGPRLTPRAQSRHGPACERAVARRRRLARGPAPASRCDLVRIGLADLSASDLQNCLCELDKNERVRLGEGKRNRSDASSRLTTEPRLVLAVVLQLLNLDPSALGSEFPGALGDGALAHLGIVSAQDFCNVFALLIRFARVGIGL